jgi:hypothetical protein
MSQFPITSFSHMGCDYEPSRAVDDDDVMVLARPDLFTSKRARSRSTTTDTTEPSED